MQPLLLLGGELNLGVGMGSRLELPLGATRHHRAADELWVRQQSRVPAGHLAEKHVILSPSLNLHPILFLHQSFWCGIRTALLFESFGERLSLKGGKVSLLRTVFTNCSLLTEQLIT